MMKFFIHTALLMLLMSASQAEGFFSGMMTSKQTPTARLISNSYFADWYGTTYTTTGMSHTNYQVSTSGVSNGDLLLVIANIDNGSDTTWPNPIFTGFTQNYQKFYGNDGQTF